MYVIKRVSRLQPTMFGSILKVGTCMPVSHRHTGILPLKKGEGGNDVMECSSDYKNSVVN